MPIRYIGRDPFFKGKSLYEICRQLRDLGVGRIVYQTSLADKWQTQKTYYRLTKVVPGMSSKGAFDGKAWGFGVFRGKEIGLQEITAGHKVDWILVPKNEEKDFCQTEKFEIDINTLPKTIPCPPLLAMAVKREMKASQGESLSQNIDVPYCAEDFVKAFSQRHNIKK